MYKYILVISIFCLSSYAVKSQQLAGWGNYRSFLYYHNPAAVPIFDDMDDGDFINLDAAYQNQWTKFDDAPTTIFLGGQYVIRDYNFALGLKITNDQFGPSSFTNVELQYAYQLKFDGWDDHFLSLGLGVSMTNFSIDGTKLNFQDPDDILAINDNQSTTFLNGTLGVYYQRPLYFANSSKYVMVGISADQAMPTPLEITAQNSSADLARVIHANAFLGLRSYHSNEEDYVELLILSRYVENIPAYFMGGVKASFMSQQFWVGAAISTDWILHPQIGVQIMENLSLGYSGGIFLANSFSANTGLTHEISIKFRSFF